MAKKGLFCRCGFFCYFFRGLVTKKNLKMAEATKKKKKKSKDDDDDEEEDQRGRKKNKKTKTSNDDDEKKKKKKKKNILICGTPGTGKSTLAKLVLEKANSSLNDNAAKNGESLSEYEYVNVGDVCKREKYYHSFDERLNSYVIDEDKILDHLEPLIEKGGMIVDYHSSEFFPERFFSHVIVLTCGREDTKILYERLEQRDGYTKEKIRQNVECEIFGECVEEAKEAYTGEGVVHVRSNETEEEMEATVKFIAEELLV
jgi:adenylate kinase